MPDPIALAENLARDFAATAVARDRAGGTAKDERDALRASGLLALVIPTDLGGLGASWETTLRAVRAIGRVDASLAHVFGFQHLLLATVRLFGNRAQFETFGRATAAQNWFWGNALNPLDPRTTIARAGNGYVLRGEKSFASGSHDADVLVVSATNAATGKLVIAAVPATRAGIETRDDWDNMGQRQTDSGSVVFTDLRIEENEILSEPGPLGSTFATLRPLISQLILSNIYLAIAEGALATARTLTRERGRAWFLSGVERIEDDPYVVAAFGDLFVEVEAARLVTEAAARTLDHAWSRAEALTNAERGEAAIAIAAAKVSTTRAGLEVTNRVFDLTGARATASRFGLDRFWRNLRTLTLHDPVDYKRRDVGRWFLTDTWPVPSFYS